MKIRPSAGVGDYRLGVDINDSSWQDLGEYLPFKRNFLQKNPAIIFPSKRVVVYFDNNNLSAGIEVLAGSAVIDNINTMGVPLKELRSNLRSIGAQYKYEDNTITIDALGVSIYFEKREGKLISTSILIFNESYMKNNDLEEYRFE